MTAMVNAGQISYPTKATGEVVTRLAVVADTHVPDQAESLPPDFIEELVRWEVASILHAGDICSKVVLEKLSLVAPVIAVRGNRDIVFARRLPLVARAEYAGVKLALMHGHGGFINYVGDKFLHYQRGYQFERYKQLLLSVAPEADVIVFGHTHMPELMWHNKQLLFNPGSLIGAKGFKPVYGILEILSSGEVNGRHIFLEGWQRKGRIWHEISQKKD